MNSVVLYLIVSRSLARLVQRKCYSYNRKTRSYHRSTQLLFFFFKVMGHETCQFEQRYHPYNRKTRSNHYLRQLHIQGHGSGNMLLACLDQFCWISSGLVIVQLSTVFCPSAQYLSFFCEALVSRCFEPSQPQS